jgi:hypothetical protein
MVAPNYYNTFPTIILIFFVKFGNISIIYSAILLAVLVAPNNINFDLVEGVTATLNLKGQAYLRFNFNINS